MSETAAVELFNQFFDQPSKRQPTSLLLSPVQSIVLDAFVGFLRAESRGFCVSTDTLTSLFLRREMPGARLTAVNCLFEVMHIMGVVDEQHRI